MSLTVCFIAKDEERCIGRAIRSVLPVADRIVVVDTGSTDGTQKVARELGARVETFAWVDDFAAARNYALTFARDTTWVAWMDCDDVLQPDSLKPLALYKSDPANCVIGWEMENVDVPVERQPDVGVQKCIQYRMFPRGVRFTNKVHETVVASATDLGLPFYNAPEIKVRHYGYCEKDIEPKLYRNARLAAIGAGWPRWCAGFSLPGGYYGFYAPYGLCVIQGTEVKYVAKLEKADIDPLSVDELQVKLAATAAKIVTFLKEGGLRIGNVEDSLQAEIDRLNEAIELNLRGVHA
jgi:glycosyltransferase involved in cell wall biosynthesis